MARWRLMSGVSTETVPTYGSTTGIVVPVSLAVPANITLVPLPSYSPEPKPGGARLALSQGTLPLASPARRLRRHRRGRMRCLEQAVG